MLLDRKLWLTEDRAKVVEDGDPNAAFLLGNEGTEVPDDEAKRLGVKAKSAPANKAKSAPANKGK